MKQTKNAQKANRLERKRLAQVDRELARGKGPKKVDEAEPKPPASNS